MPQVSVILSAVLYQSINSPGISPGITQEMFLSFIKETKDVRSSCCAPQQWGDFLLWRFSHCLWLCQPYLPQLFLSSHISSMNLIRAFLFCSYIQNRLENLCIWLQTVTKLGTLINISIIHFQELWKWIYSSGLILTSSMIIFINSTSFSILGNNSVW